MNEIERYLLDIIEDLPISDHEKVEMYEEFTNHLNEHIRELMIKGYTEKEATLQAIESFGSKNKINREMKKVLFPFFKVARYLSSVLGVTFVFWILSYSVMEYYHPEFENSVPIISVIAGMGIIAILAGAAEAIFEAICDQFSSKWIANPWFVFMVPSLFIGGLMISPYFDHPDQYLEGRWLDLISIPLGAVIYMIFRELFTAIFGQRNRYFKKAE
ncbi:permease prefix domain 1-containing protein [Cytobacillus sp. Hz8]|uniref:permease prefix domain 1-containing protein n=1 Tax=Cytobacillus sp. Hz8 TaxID=3347168 RepID=UPI0035D8C1F3